MKTYYQKNKKRIIQKQKEYNQKNKERIKLYLQNNKERIHLKQKLWYQKNRGIILKKAKRYFLTPKGKILKKKHDKKYRESVKGILNHKLRKHKRRKLEKRISHNFTLMEWFLKRYHTQGFCPNCDKHVGVDELTLDHIIPIAKAPFGFVYTINDIQPLCHYCNSSKRDVYTPKSNNTIETS